MEFRILNGRDRFQAAEWRAIHRSWRQREVFADPAYVRLFAGEREEPLAAYAATSHGFVLYPFILRPVDAAGLSSPTAPLADITSPYGGGGAFHEGMTDIDGKEFWTTFDRYCRQRRVVSEFVRLHVLPDIQLPYPGPTEVKLTQVVRNLDLSADEIWREFEHKVRKNVNRARREGVRIEIDESGQRLDEFLRIYHGTMRRRGARAYYHFPRSMFQRLVLDLPGQFVFFHAWHDGRMVSSELVLVSAENIYSFLGGTAADAFELRPNDLLKFEIISWGQRQGKRRFILGGGYAPDDGIFRYKRAFAPDGLRPYLVGSRILDEATYRRLTAAHECAARRRNGNWRSNPGFFPAYRQE